MAIPTVNEAPNGYEALDLHGAYMMARECGMDSDMPIKTGSVQKIASRLRGISGITAVLMTDPVDVDLGEYIRGALVEALNALADDCIDDLDEIQSRHAEKRVAA